MRTVTVVREPAILPRPKAGAVLSVVPEARMQGVKEPPGPKCSPEPMIIRYPAESRLNEARGKIDPEQNYTLSEAAAVTGISRYILERLIKPVSVRLACRQGTNRRGKTHRVKGSDVLAVVERIDTIPLQTRTLRELAEAMGRTFQGLKQNLVWKEGQRYAPYRRAQDGCVVLIPLHRWLDGQNLVLGEREFQYVAADRRRKLKLLNWGQAQDYLARKGVNLLDAQLKSEIAQQVRKGRGSNEESEPTLAYTSPNGEDFRISAIRMVRRTKNDYEYRFHPEDLDRLAQRILKDQNGFVPMVELQDGRANNRVVKGKPFSLDGVEYKLQIHRKGRIRYANRDVMRAYNAWQKMMAERDRTYLACRWVCKAFKAEEAVRNYAKFLDRLQVHDGRLVFPLSGIYDLDVWVRELNGVLYLHTDAAELVRFFINATHHDSRVRAKAVHRLEAELGARKVSMKNMRWRIGSGLPGAYTCAIGKQSPEAPRVPLPILKD